ncbi:MAG: hypothetical protein ACRDDX_02865 [Cellulosilyticaceae bacterium]
MEEIIQEIAKIDSRIRASKSQSEERIEARRKYYETQMEIYETERIKEANEKSEELYKGIIVGAEQQAQFEEEKAKQMALLVENRYLQVEGKMLEALFDKLFIVEA